jgi:hypothetical protein
MSCAAAPVSSTDTGYKGGATVASAMPDTRAGRLLPVQCPDNRAIALAWVHTCNYGSVTFVMAHAWYAPTYFSTFFSVAAEFILRVYSIALYQELCACNWLCVGVSGLVCLSLAMRRCIGALRWCLPHRPCIGALRWCLPHRSCNRRPHRCNRTVLVW